MTFGLNTENPIELLLTQLQALLHTLKGGGIDHRTVKMPVSLLVSDFGINQSVVSQEQQQTIDHLVVQVLNDPALEIDSLVGRASQTGNESNNTALSEARASAVLDVLDQTIYPPPPVIGLGSTDPIQVLPNAESEFNRSVEIKMWYDLSYFFHNTDDSWIDLPPAQFFREYTHMLHGTKFARAALIVELVYNNIDTLYVSAPGSANDIFAGIVNFGTIYQDDALVKSRIVLAEYKQTLTGSAAGIHVSTAAFNTLLQNNGLSPNDFTGEEISDAEHFCTASVISSVPLAGLVAAQYAIYLWDGISGVKALIEENDQLAERNFDQLNGPDMAGAIYGVVRYASAYGGR